MRFHIINTQKNFQNQCQNIKFVLYSNDSYTLLASHALYTPFCHPSPPQEDEVTKCMWNTEHKSQNHWTAFQQRAPQSKLQCNKVICSPQASEVIYEATATTLIVPPALNGTHPSELLSSWEQLQRINWMKYAMLWMCQDFDQWNLHTWINIEYCLVMRLLHSFLYWASCNLKIIATFIISYQL